MNWKDIGKTIAGKGLPILGGLLGGKAGEKGGEIIAGFLGCDPTPEDVSNALENNPDLYVDLKKFELENKKELMALKIQEAGMYLADKQSARQREIETTKATGKRDWFLYALATSFVIGFFVTMIIFINHPPADNNTIIGMIIQALISGVIMILSYFFGSSKGSADKNSMIGSKN